MAGMMSLGPCACQEHATAELHPALLVFQAGLKLSMQHRLQSRLSLLSAGVIWVGTTKPDFPWILQWTLA